MTTLRHERQIYNTRVSLSNRLRSVIGRLLALRHCDVIAHCACLGLPVLPLSSQLEIEYSASQVHY